MSCRYLLPPDIVDFAERFCGTTAIWSESMSFSHHLYVEHFDRDENGVRFARPSAGQAFRPVISERLTLASLVPSIERATKSTTTDIPNEWSAWIHEAGHIVCDLYTRNEQEIEFVSDLVSRDGCQLYDVAAHGEISLHEWLERIHASSLA